MTTKSVLTTLAMILIGIAILSPSAFAWSYPPQYTQGYNVTIKNWAYTANYSNSIYGEPNASYALIKVQNIGDVHEVKIDGYNNLGNDVGHIPFYFVNKFQNTTYLLVSKYTTQGQPYSTASIFYNPVATSILNNYQMVIPTPPSIINGNLTISTITPDSDLGGFPSQWPNLILNNFMVGNWISGVVEANFTIGTNNNQLQSFVVVSDHTLGGDLYESWNPDNINHYTIQSILNTYHLTGGFGAFVTQPLSVSKNPNIIFNKTGYSTYEGYFSTHSEQVLTEQLRVNQSLNNGEILNTTTHEYAGFSGFVASDQFDIRYWSNTPTQILIMPSFTTNVSVTSIAPNTNVYNPFTNNVTTYCYGYEYVAPITNITWNVTSAFKSYAVPGHLGVSTNLSALNTPLLMLNVTHYAGVMGNDCQDVHFQADLKGQDDGSVGFAINNVTPLICSYILKNRTSYGNVYNSVSMYFDSILNTSNYDNNQSIMNQYIVATGNYFTIDTPQKPYLITLTQPLNPNSVISGTYGCVNGYFSCSWETSELNTYAEPDFASISSYYFAGGGYHGTTSSINDTLSTNKQLFGFGSFGFASPTLSVTSSGLSNVTNTIIPGGQYTLVGGITPTLTFNLQRTKATITNITATASQSNVGQWKPTTCWEMITKISNSTSPPLTNTTPTKFNLTTTSIDYSALNQTTTIYPGVSMTKGEADILSVIALIIMAFTFDGDSPFIFGIGLIFVFIMGLFDWPLEIVVGVIVGVFIIYEYIEGKRRGDHK